MGGGWVGGGGQDGCESRIEIFVKIQKNIRGEGGWRGGGIRGGGVGLGGHGGCERRIEVFGTIPPKNVEGGGSLTEGVRWGVDVNAMLGVGGDVGYGGCETRIEGIVQCTKRYCTILRK